MYLFFVLKSWVFQGIPRHTLVSASVTKCPARTQQASEAKAKCKKALEDAKRKREEKTVHELELRAELDVSRVGESEEVTCVGSS